MTARFSEFSVAGHQNLLDFVSSHTSHLIFLGVIKQSGSQLIFSRIALIKQGIHIFKETSHVSMNVMGFEKNQMDGIGKGEGRCLLGRYGNFLHIALLLKTEDCLGGPSSINFFTRISACRSPMYLGVGPKPAPASR